MDEELTLTAYHEAGHAVIGYALGGTVESMQLGGEADDWLPERFGDCRIQWGRVDVESDSQTRREVLTILAGPVAEMVYLGQPLHPAYHGPWQHDWQRAAEASSRFAADPEKRVRLLERLIVELRDVLAAEPCWPAIAALADALEAHETLEAEEIEDILGFWFRRDLGG